MEKPLDSAFFASAMQHLLAEKSGEKGFFVAEAYAGG